jgi:hypothetical protein
VNELPAEFVDSLWVAVCAFATFTGAAESLVAGGESSTF